MGLNERQRTAVRDLRVALGWAGLLGLTAVAAGAFGAHGVADPRAKAWLQTGGEYGMVHALAALAALTLARSGARLARVAAWLLLAGATVFSASLYLMALSGRLWLGARHADWWCSAAGGLGLPGLGWVRVHRGVIPARDLIDR